MERDELLDRLADADTLHEMSDAISDARTWLADHPDDPEVITAVGDLLEVERELFR
jgi:cytochrome c-type biogenesis protein CcmH/NrfG